jgi:hypothetical protein
LLASNGLEAFFLMTTAFPKAFSVALLAATATTLSVGAVSPALAFTVDFTSLGVTGGQPSLTFTNGPLALTAAPVGSTQGYVQATTTGLCVFANTTDGTHRCGLGVDNPTATNYDNIGISPNFPISYTGFSISQVLNQAPGFIDPNPPGTGEIYVRRGSPSGTLLETINISSLTVPTAVIPFSMPYSFAAGEQIFFQASGSNSSVRLGKLEAVPGPLPLLGAGAAFGWSRRLRVRARGALVSTR